MTTRRFAVALALLALPGTASAQVVITELQCDPTSTNDDGEWIELQNLGASAEALAGWTLNDYSGSAPDGEATTRWAFPPGALIDAGAVIVVAKFASGPGYSDNTPAGLYATPPTFELASGAHDDPNVPNLVPSGGTTLMQLANGSTGDGVVLRDALGATVSAVEWGSVDRTVAGLPAAVPGSSTSLRRIALTGSAAADFVVAATPDPFVGYATGMGTPPAVTGTSVTPRHLASGAQVTVTSSVSDADGVAMVAAHRAIATSSVAAATAAYIAAPMAAGLGASWSVTFDPGLAPPATFHERYVRVFVTAADTTGATSVDPPLATSDAANPAYIWRNVLPAAASPITEVRAQDASGRLAWRYHSATIEGVVLTRRAAFVSGRTNFFVQTLGGGDAIRVFANALVPEDVMPGDLVRVTGMIDTFNGLRQLGEPELDVEVLGTGATPAPAVYTIAELTARGEELESRLIRVLGATFVTPAASWPTNGNVDITDGTGTVTVRVTTVVDLSGAPAPLGAFDLTGVLGQFSAGGSGGYQLLPRSALDVSGAMVPADGGVGADGGLDPDGGVTLPDAGPLPDTGLPSADGGLLADAGTPAADAGKGDEGGGGVADAGGGGADATVIPRQDSGSGGGGGSRRDEEGGCGCTAAERRSGAGQRAELAAAVAAIALLLGARRRRQRAQVG